jgi:hypothetical protein
MRVARTTVRLTGIALRHQGSHDSLCAYYAAAMMLCALRPELDEQFDAAHVAHDPLFRHLPRRRGHSVERVAAEWLASGVMLPSLARALGGACAGGGVRTRFRHRRARADGDTLGFLRAQVAAGLPCLIGWDSRELGCHTSLVVGHDHYPARRSHFVRVLDPIRMQEQIEWRQLARLASGPLDLIFAHVHEGVRPDKLTVDRRGDGSPIRTRVERWDPRAAGWQTLY